MGKELPAVGGQGSRPSEEPGWFIASGQVAQGGCDLPQPQLGPHLLLTPRECMSGGVPVCFMGAGQDNARMEGESSSTAWVYMYIYKSLLYFLIFYLFIWLCRVLVVAYGIFPDQGSNRGAQSLSHWTTREVPFV